ncbi:MAG: hypothetical protein ACO294_11475 [Methylococcales bacterium]
MINLNLELSMPYSQRWAHIYFIDGMLAKYKAWEFQIMKTPVLIQLQVDFRLSGDHAGLRLAVGFLGYSCDFNVFDTRHWDYEKRCWER